MPNNAFSGCFQPRKRLPDDFRRARIRQGEFRGGANSNRKPCRPSTAGPRPTAPAAEAQRTGALTGEPFESYFDDSTGEWRYRDCMALDAAGAAAVGLPARRCLVKASALLMGDGGDDDDDDDGEGDDDDDDDEGDGSGGSEGEGDGKEAGGKRENGENDGDLDHQPSSVPLEQVEAALAEAAAAVGEAEGGADEEREDDEDPTTTRVKEEAAA